MENNLKKVKLAKVIVNSFISFFFLGWVLGCSSTTSGNYPVGAVVEKEYEATPYQWDLNDTEKTKHNENQLDNGRVPLTGVLIEQNNLKEDDLKRLQFYISESLVLEREVLSGDKSIIKGKIISRSGKVIEIIEVYSGTEGIALEYDSENNSLSISFQEGSFFYFVEEYHNNGFVIGIDSDSELEFDNVFYKVTQGSKAKVLIDLESINNVAEKRRVLKGRKIKE